MAVALLVQTFSQTIPDVSCTPTVEQPRMVIQEYRLVRVSYRNVVHIHVNDDRAGVRRYSPLEIYMLKGSSDSKLIITKGNYKGRITS